MVCRRQLNERAISLLGWILARLSVRLVVVAGAREEIRRQFKYVNQMQIMQRAGETLSFVGSG